MAKKQPVKRTKFQRFQRASTNYCNNPSKTNAERLKKAEKTYKEDALSKGKPKGDVNATIQRTKKCSTK